MTVAWLPQTYLFCCLAAIWRFAYGLLTNYITPQATLQLDKYDENDQYWTVTFGVSERDSYGVAYNYSNCHIWCTMKIYRGAVQQNGRYFHGKRMHANAKLISKPSTIASSPGSPNPKKSLDMIGHVMVGCGLTTPCKIRFPWLTIEVLLTECSLWQSPAGQPLDFRVDKDN